MNPQDFDIYHVGISGGKDSTATALWARFESGWKNSRFVLDFCDTGNEDYYTYAFIALLSEVLDMPIHVTEPDLDFWELAKKKKRFPSRKARFCTQHLKVIPSMRRIQELSSNKVLAISGIRKDEGRKGNNDRGELEQFYFDDSYGCWKYLPIYEYSMEEVWGIHKRYIPLQYVQQIIEDDPDETMDEEHPFVAGMTKREWLLERTEAHGIPCNPLYTLGASRVGCFPCINSRKAEIRAMNIFRPKRIEFIAEREEETGNSSNTEFSGFFSAKTVPPRWRSREITTSKGETVKVCTIHDVSGWANTVWGGKQLSFDFLNYQDTDVISCDMKGMCE